MLKNEAFGKDRIYTEYSGWSKKRHLVSHKEIQHSLLIKTLHQLRFLIFSNGYNYLLGIAVLDIYDVLLKEFVHTAKRISCR